MRHLRRLGNHRNLSVQCLLYLCVTSIFDYYIYHVRIIHNMYITTKDDGSWTPGNGATIDEGG
jgi:hypothetical protein